MVFGDEEHSAQIQQTTFTSRTLLPSQRQTAKPARSRLRRHHIRPFRLAGNDGLVRDRFVGVAGKGGGVLSVPDAAGLIQTCPAVVHFILGGEL